MPKIEGIEALPGRAHFFHGNDPSRWTVNVPTYGAVAYSGLYPGIDMIYRGGLHHLKSEFVVAAGADVEQIRLLYTGAKRVYVDKSGALVLETGDGDLREEAPKLYQEIQGRRANVMGSYRLFADGSVGFALGAYDRGRSIVIDPTLVYSTYLGGDQPDSGAGIAIDVAGNAYITGWTVSTNFPAINSYNGNNSGGVDAFVTKLSATGNAVVYSTYLGGSGDDRGLGIAVDASGNAYVTGWTYSANFPTSSALQPRLAGAQNAFMAKLNAAGNTLLYSTYLGGAGFSSGTGIAVDATDNAYVTGETTSVNFPTLNAFRSVNAGIEDAFVTKLNASGSAILYSTYLGGSQNDHASGIAVDTAGNAYIAGWTFSRNFPVANALQPVSGGGQDAFITKLNAAGNALLYSTYLGGSGGSVGLSEAALAIAVDAAGNAYVTGTTSSNNFPVVNAWQPAHVGGNTAFVAKLNTSGGLVYSTYLGGSNLDFGTGIAVDQKGNAYVTGYTFSPDFPTDAPLQAANAGDYDAFVTKFNTAGAVVWSTYLGGSGSDSATAIAADGAGNVYITGQTLSGDFPVLNFFQSEDTGNWSAFVAKVAAGARVSKAGAFGGGAWMIDQNGNGQWDRPEGGDRFFLLGQTGDIAVVGDWNGDGRAKAGIFRNGVWVMDYNGNGLWDGPPVDRAFGLGQAGDIPVVGDWNGDGRAKAGIFRAGLWVLDYNGNGQWDGGVVDRAFYLGQAGDIPVVGDWNGSGTAKAGIFRAGVWVLDYNGNGQWDGGVVDRAFALGQGGDTPVVGDWNGSGTAKAGIFRAGLWLLDYNGNGQWDGTPTDRAFSLGQLGDMPVVGDWNGDGKAKAAIFRNGLWVFDYNGNGQWDGPGGGDRSGLLGQAGDTPVAGVW